MLAIKSLLMALLKIKTLPMAKRPQGGFSGYLIVKYTKNMTNFLSGEERGENPSLFQASSILDVYV